MIIVFPSSTFALGVVRFECKYWGGMVKRYSYKSLIKKFSVTKGREGEFLYMESLKNPSKQLSKDKYAELVGEVSMLVKKSWGEFEQEYIEKNVMNVLFLCLLRNSEHTLIGIAPVKRLKIFDKNIYSFGLSVILPKYRNLKLLKTMFEFLVKKILMRSFSKGIFSVEFVFITPNIKTLGTLARLSSFMYPNPFAYNRKRGKIKEADPETWKMVKEYLKISGEKPRVLLREGCIMEGFYDERPHLIQKYSHHRNKTLNEFGQKYLYSVPGREVVARVKLSLRSLIKNELGIF